MKIPVIATLLFLLPFLANAEDSLVVEMGGKGEYQIGATPVQQFRNLTFLSSNGKSEYSMDTTSGMIGFAGGKDFQPSANDYLLQVDGIVNISPDMTANRIAASGQCKMKQSTDGMVVYSVVCSANSEFGKARMHFVGDGKKVKITDGPPGSQKAD
jgi:hypothetical protein